MLVFVHTFSTTFDTFFLREVGFFFITLRGKGVVWGEARHAWSSHEWERDSAIRIVKERERGVEPSLKLISVYRLKYNENFFFFCFNFNRLKFLVTYRWFMTKIVFNFVNQTSDKNKLLASRWILQFLTINACVKYSAGVKKNNWHIAANSRGPFVYVSDKFSLKN